MRKSGRCSDLRISCSVLALVACAVFLKKTKRQGFMLWGPMVFMMAVTFTALAMTITKLGKALVTTGLSLGNTLQLVFAVLLLILRILVAIQGNQNSWKSREGKKKSHSLDTIFRKMYYLSCTQDPGPGAFYLEGIWKPESALFR